MSKSEREASHLLERVGIAIRWTDILTADPGRGVEQIRQEPDDPSHFTITVDNKFLNLSLTDTALGFAMPLVGNRAQAGVVYHAVERVAQDNRDLIDCGLLLGVVLAHEIAHLLLGSIRHGLGLLQANWMRTEFKRMAQHHFLFLPEQGEALRRGLAVPMYRSAVGVDLASRAIASPLADSTTAAISSADHPLDTVIRCDSRGAWDRAFASLF